MTPLGPLPKRAYMRHGIAFLRPEMLNSRHERPYVRLWRVNLRPGIAELKPEKVKFKAQAGQFKA